MKLIFPLYLAMLAMIGLGAYLHTPVLANLVGLASITGLLVFLFRQPAGGTKADALEMKPIELEIEQIDAQQKKHWYSLFVIGLIFSLVFGSFWNSQIGGM